MIDDRRNEPDDPNSPDRGQPAPGKERDIGDADDVSFPFPALDPPEEWPDPSFPTRIPERELA